MTNKSIRFTIATLTTIITFACLLNSACKNIPAGIKSEYNYIEPNYDLVQLKTVPDTLSFPLDQFTYNSIKSFNVFTDNGQDFISFFDIRSSSLSIYQLATRSLEKRISLPDILKKKKLYRATVFVKNFDSIFINNSSTLYLTDSSGRVKTSIRFLEDEKTIYATFGQTTPPIFKNGLLYTGVRPYVEDNSLKALRKWKVMYEFNLQDNKPALHYNLPDLYRNDYYGYHFLDYGYCYNNQGNFVFSFPADSTIYETNFSDYHISYLAKSIQHTIPVKPLTKKEVNDKDTSYKKYLLQDSYGPVFFDSYHKRYLRVFKPRISERAFNNKEGGRINRFIILNEQFQIIGESPVPEGVLYNSVFFTNDGKMFARTKTNDEYALHFVKMEYQEQSNDAIHLTRLNNSPDK